MKNPFVLAVSQINTVLVNSGQCYSCHSSLNSPARRAGMKIGFANIVGLLFLYIARKAHEGHALFWALCSFLLLEEPFLNARDGTANSSRSLQGMIGMCEMWANPLNFAFFGQVGGKLLAYSWRVCILMCLIESVNKAFIGETCHAVSQTIRQWNCVLETRYEKWW